MVNYDGVTSLGVVLSDLLARLELKAKKNPGNNGGLSFYCKTAIAAGVVSDSRAVESKKAIYRWYAERLTAGNTELFKALGITSVSNVKQTNIETISPLVDSGVAAVSNIKQDDDAAETWLDSKDYHYAITITHQGKPKRTTVRIDGYLVKALASRHGLADNSAIRQWIEQAIKQWSAFDSFLPITRQVNRLMVESLA